MTVSPVTTDKIRRALSRLAAAALAATLAAGCGGGGPVGADDAAQPAAKPAEKPEPTSPRLRVDFGRDWSFHRGEAKGAFKPGFDDSTWRALDVPHDWAIEGPFDQKSPGGTGAAYLPGGVGWYRKTFDVPDAGRVLIEFDGVYMESKAWLNGKLLGERPYGYSSFAYDLTPHLRRGGRGEKGNVIAVRVEVKRPCSLWYSGAGIYRNVYLTVTDAVHVAHWGTHVTTPAVSDAEATVRVRTRVRNDCDREGGATLETYIVDADRRTVARAQASQRIAAAGEREFDQLLKIARPRLWSAEDPYLYRVVSLVKQDGRVIDEYETPLGVRTFRFDANAGFFLNGKNVRLKGVCMHHDLGPLGAAVSRRAVERQMEIMKSMGANAVRTSHNPPAPEVLDACDRQGLLVTDEAFDEWKASKRKYGYGRFFDKWAERDLADMIRRDRNHPCVIMWSIGNEIREQGSGEGAKLSKMLVDICHREDPTRPVTAGCNNLARADKTGFSKPLDVVGINYHPADYAPNHKRFPERVIVASETSSASSSRGVYIFPGDTGSKKGRDNQLTEYDLCCPRWGCTAEHSLQMLKKSPFVAGEFVWTGFDYIGEPTPFKWPSRSSYFGIVDLCGFPKDRYHLYRSQWTAEPMVHVLPHWTWPGREGKKIPVWCYTNCETVELFLNGKSLGKKQTRRAKDLHLVWEVRYAPGELKAVARAADGTIVQKVVSTAGKPAKLVLEADRSEIAADGRDLSFVTVSVRDGKGDIVPTAAGLVRFEVAGPGEIAAVGNGDATSHESFRAKERRVFNGLCLVVVRATDNPGDIQLTARSEGLRPAGVTVRSR